MYYGTCLYFFSHMREHTQRFTKWAFTCWFTNNSWISCCFHQPCIACGVQVRLSAATGEKMTTLSETINCSSCIYIKCSVTSCSVHESSFPWFTRPWHVILHFLLLLQYVWLLFSCLHLPHRGDSGVSERAAGDLSQFAVQAWALSVHPQASQWLCGSFSAAAPGRGQRHRPGSHLLHGYAHKYENAHSTIHYMH